MGGIVKYLGRLLRRRPKISVLEGGRRPVEAEIRRVRKLGAGTEGEVREIEVTLKSGKRSRTITLAEKKFFKLNRGATAIFGKAYKNPEVQVRIYKKLRELNSSKNLGIRIPTTFRLKRNGKKISIVLTKLLIPKSRDLVTEMITSRQWDIVFGGMEKEFGIDKADAKNDYFYDRNRQISKLEQNGYWANAVHSFMPAYDPKSGKAIAVLVDFGEVSGAI